MNISDPDLSIRHIADRFTAYAARLQAIFTAMDHAYGTVAEIYRFHCSGCEDNCCQTRFFHHTYLEYFYLHHGWQKLEPQQRAVIQSRSKDVCRSMASAAPGREASRQMCPLNHRGLCELYAYRPMICRLHGIPHVLQRPDGKKTIGPGCDAFYRQGQSSSDAALERTPHYTALADLEREFRRSTEFGHKLRLTVADMIVRFTV